MGTGSSDADGMAAPASGVGCGPGGGGGGVWTVGLPFGAGAPAAVVSEQSPAGGSCRTTMGKSRD
eukprot:12285959-Prorocentrum_lima.AAC.1